MMIQEIETIDVEGIHLIVPGVLKRNWPKIPLCEFPSFCGAGEGFGETVIPDTNYFLSIKHVCFIHDITHTIFPPTREYWHFSNQIMLLNHINTIMAKSESRVLRMLREHRAITYYQGVESKTGWKCFINRSPGNIGQEEYTFEKDLGLREKLYKVGVSIIV